MALKKSYAAKIKDGKIVTPQRDVNMHALEEAETFAKWALADLRRKLPMKPSQADEHELIVNNQADLIKPKRAEWQMAIDAAQPALIEAEKAWRAAEAEWNKHAILAHANGFDPDTHPDARNLTMPVETK